MCVCVCVCVTRQKYISEKRFKFTIIVINVERNLRTTLSFYR